jgi:oligoribonuclease NrnB/cAMP/cGMP phosphodiesterase (DHH superfamily)
MVIYHGGCADGFTSAWIAARFYGENACELVPVAYSDPEPPDVTGRNVLMVDFSYKRPVMEGIISRAKSVVVLDHHKTAEAELDGLEGCTFDMNECGASLTWKHLHPYKDMPWLVDYVRDRDLWIRELADTKAISAYIAVQPRTLEAWDEMAKAMDDDFGRIRDAGQAILAHIEQFVENRKRSAFVVIIDDQPMLCINTPFNMVSDLLHALCSDAIPAAISFTFTGERWAYSIRSINDLDVSDVARSRGGGGHPQACGFDSGRELIPEIADVLATAERLDWPDA